MPKKQSKSRADRLNRRRGRRLTGPTLDTADIHLLAAIRSAEGKTPRDLKLAGAVIKMLLERIRRMDRHTAKYIEGILQMLVGIESFTSQFTDVQLDTTTVYQECLIRIGGASIPRGSHMPNVLDVQKLLLAQYMTIHPPPLDPTASKDTKNWVCTNWDAIHDFIGWLPCLCNYSATFDNSLFSRQYDVAEQGAAGLIHTILAFLHNSTSENIKKLLRQADKILFRSSS
jgi:hypothetical protein